MARELSAYTIDNLKAGLTRREIADGRVPSLYLVLQPSGWKSWAYRYVLLGRKRKLTIGSYPRVGIKEAREAAWKAKDLVDQGIDPAAAKKTAKAALLASTAAPDDLVEDVVEEFLRRYGPTLKASTRHDVARILHKDIVPAWRGRRLSEIGRKDAIRLLDAVEDRGARVGANRLKAWGSRLYKWAIARGLAETNPFAGIEGAIETSRDRVLSDAEIRLIWDACEHLDDLQATFIRLLILTGCRRGEVAGMRKEEVDIAAGRWVIPAARTKGGREHVAQLSSGACYELFELGGRTGEYVLGATGRKPLGGFDNIKKQLDEHLPADMRPWRFHDLRRTFATGLAKLGVAIHVTEACLGHRGGSFRGITSVYQKYDYARECGAAVELWYQHVDELVRGIPPVVTPFRRV